MSSESSKPTLYERLGGVYSIAAVVDAFIDRVMHNPVLNANAAIDEAHHRVSAVVPENSIRRDSRGETESAHHPMRCLRSSTYSQRL
jgi:hypothetical protein